MPRVDLDRLVAESRNMLEPAAFAYLATGAGEGVTAEENVTAWRGFRFLPRVLRDVSAPNISTTVLGTKIDLPVLIAPVARQALCVPEAEAVTAQAANAAGTIMVVSAFSSLRLEEVIEPVIEPKLWFQLYVTVDRGRARDLVERAETAGYSALVLTVDTPVDGLRRYDPVPDLPDRGKILGNFKSSRGLDAAGGLDASVSFEVLEWLRAQSRLPIVVKGIMRAEDARESVSRGASAVVVSNHGGRQLDRAQATALALREVVDAVGDSAEVYVDGGIRSGSDILVALALGARAVLIGRPAIWALTTGGASGVRTLLEWLGYELKVNMQLCGVKTLVDVNLGVLAI